MVFENENVNFNTKTYEEIFTELLDIALNEGLISDDGHFPEYIAQTKRIENTMILDLSSFSRMASLIYMDMDKFYNSMDLNKATGYALDMKLNPFLERIPPAAAIGMVKFSTAAPATYDLEIPVGTVVNTSGDRIVSFVTTESQYLLEGTTSVEIPAVCTEYGTVGNVPAHEIDELEIAVTGIYSVDNLLGFTGGVDLESNESYRERGRNWKYIVVRGTYDAILNSIISIPSVSSYYIDRYWNGYGTTRIVIAPDTPPVLELVEAAIDEVKACDEDITIVGAEDVEVDVSFIANVTLDTNVSYSEETIRQIEFNIEKAIKAYIDGGYNSDGTIKSGMGIAEDFVPIKAISYVLSQVPQLQNLELVYPAEPVTIQSYEKAVSGEVTITVE